MREALARKRALEIEDTAKKSEKLRLEYENLHKKYSEELISRGFSGSILNEEIPDSLEESVSDGQVYTVLVVG